MADKIIGKLPEFSSDETPPEKKGQEEEKEAVVEETTEEERDTPSELPAEEKPAEEPEEKGEGDDTEGLIKQTDALKREREKILKDIQDLRGERRELKQKQLDKVEEAIDDLKDVHPKDAEVIEKVLRAKGYVRKEDVEKRIYQESKQQQLDSFLNKHPEYKPENDKSDINWSRLQRELEFYRMPQDPKKIGSVLERAHRAISGSLSGGQTVSAKKHLAKVAGSGGAGAKSLSSRGGTLSPEQKEQYRRGGWSEEEIKNIEKNLPE